MGIVFTGHSIAMKSQKGMKIKKNYKNLTLKSSLRRKLEKEMFLVT